MNLELKNIKVYEQLSEETIAFSADIFVDKKKVGYATNNGRGGSTNYHAELGKKIPLAAAEAYCAVLPETKHKVNGKTVTIPSSLENWIDGKVFEFAEEKAKKDFDKRIKRLCQTSIVWGTPDGSNAYSMSITRPKRKISELMVTPQGKAAVMLAVVKVRAQLRKGEVIFNTNVTHSV